MFWRKTACLIAENVGQGCVFGTIEKKSASSITGICFSLTFVLSKMPLLLTAYNSKYIEQKLGEIKDRKSKNSFLESIMNDPTAALLFEVNGHKTVLFPDNKGPKTKTWEQTKQMAFELNKAGYDVAFIPEIDDETCADSLIMIDKVYKLADFKYCITTSPNTLAKELEHGFKQASTMILKPEFIDSGMFNEAVDYLLRNDIHYGNIVLMNKYGKVRLISHKDIKSKVYVRKTKGFL